MKRMLTACLLCLAAVQMPLTAAAQEHYDVYNYDRWSEAVPSQAGYTAVRSVSGEMLGAGDFSQPSDLFLDAEDRLYIADTGNDRIVVTDAALTEVMRIYDTFVMPDGSETAISQPKGIYVAPETELLYIADYGNARVLVSDLDGQVQLVLTRPEDALYEKESSFLPQRVLADKGGNVYVVTSSTSGAAMFGADGTFQGFFGANAVESTPAVIAGHIRDLLSTQEMRSRRARTVPTAITSFDLDADGFIYTCTQSTSQDADIVKKLNPAGNNLFSGMYGWGDLQPVYDAGTNTTYEPMLCDIEISEDENINCLDRTTNRVFQYDKEGDLLFILGSTSDQLGGFTEATSLETCGNTILVLDGRKNTVTVMEETNFGTLVHKATALFNDGYYEEALEPWYEVLRYDGSYRQAFLGISAGLLVQGDYEGSMKYAKLADSSYRYDRAFECWRQEWLTEHSRALALGALLLIAGGILLHRYWKKHRKGGMNR